MARDRRAVVGVTVAAAVVVGVVAIIVVFGVVPLPRYDRLADDPEPAIPGTVAFTRPDDGGLGACLYTVPAGGGPEHQVVCEPDGIAELAWTADGLVAATVYQPFGSAVVVYDPGDGREVDRLDGDLPAGERAPDSRAPSAAIGDLIRARRVRADGSRLEVTASDGRVVLRVRDPQGEARELLRADGPRDYGYPQVQWSPDGRWVLVLDSRERLIVVSEDAGVAPRALAEDAASPAWFIPGRSAYSVELPALAGRAGGGGSAGGADRP